MTRFWNRAAVPLSAQSGHSHAFHEAYSTDCYENVLTFDECISYNTSSLLLSFCYYLSLSLTHFLSFCYPCTNTYTLFFPSTPLSTTVFSHSVSNWPHGWTLAARVFECFSVCVCSVLFIVDLDIGLLL